MISVKAIREGNRRELARLLTLVENDEPQGRAAMDELFAHTGRAHLVGITGSPGTGKSSLANQLAGIFRQPPEGKQPVKVAIVAVDPSSPFTGGALLGDRVRMKDHFNDPGVFIRSMASRGALGGIARSTAAVVQTLDAAGFEVILIETVGAGQAEVDIARLAHTTIVVEAPGLGDDIQAIKAGILEIADILVVNKADLPGAENTGRALKASLEMAHPTRKSAADVKEIWMPPVLLAQSLNPVGINEVFSAIHAHRDYLMRSGEWQRRERERLENEIRNLLQMRMMARWRESLPEEEWNRVLQLVNERKLSPDQAVDAFLKE